MTHREEMEQRARALLADALPQIYDTVACVIRDNGWKSGIPMREVLVDADSALKAMQAFALSERNDGWRDIETAPMMEEIDIWIEALDGEGWRVTGEILSKQEPLWIQREDGSIYWAHENGGWPSHWRPLPEPPATAIRSNQDAE